MYIAAGIPRGSRVPDSGPCPNGTLLCKARSPQEEEQVSQPLQSDRT